MTTSSIALFVAIALMFMFGAWAVGRAPTDSRAEDAAPTTSPAAETMPGTPPFAVVELFTSEGCSSCPPADKVLADIANENSGSVLTIAYHVDYWDRLGWRDRFDDPAFSARQQAYARAMKLDSIYTPQMIVNGRVEFVGSDRQAADDAIAAALRAPPRAGIELQAEWKDANTVTVKWKENGGAIGSVLRLVLVENGLVTAVKRGENAGHSLKHESVARAMVDVPMREGVFEGEAKLVLPADAKPENVQLIGFLQSNDDLAILGAAPRITPLTPGK